MENRVYGYARVSSKEQNADRQIQALLDFGVDEHSIIVDKKSGKDIILTAITNSAKSPHINQIFQRCTPLKYESIPAVVRLDKSDFCTNLLPTLQ